MIHLSNTSVNLRTMMGAVWLVVQASRTPCGSAVIVAHEYVPQPEIFRSVFILKTFRGITALTKARGLFIGARWGLSCFLAFSILGRIITPASMLASIVPLWLLQRLPPMPLRTPSNVTRIYQNRVYQSSKSREDWYQENVIDGQDCGGDTFLRAFLYMARWVYEIINYNRNALDLIFSSCIDL